MSSGVPPVGIGVRATLLPWIRTAGLVGAAIGRAVPI
jgi:hypothetical protein